MTPPPDLAGAHLRTYQTIFQHPVSHNLGWHDVHALLRQLGEVEEQANGNLKVTRNGHTAVLPVPHTKDVEVTEELMKLRRFLDQSEVPVPTAPAAGARWLVVMDHHAARIFHTDAPGTVPEEVRAELAAEADGHGPGLDRLPRNERKPVPHGFFGAIATALQPAGQILLFGSGTGTANAMEQFAAWLKSHHPELARRITGRQSVDAHHRTDAQLLAQARDFYPPPRAQHSESRS